jgi:hypothetical protein
MNEEFAS